MIDANIFHPLMCDYGRGPQLRGTRITIYDLIPYLKQTDYSDERMLEAWPSVNAEGLGVLKAFVAANLDEAMAANDRIDARIARDSAAQQTREFQDRSWWTRARRADFYGWLRDGNNPQGRTLSESMVEFRLQREAVRHIGAA